MVVKVLPNWVYRDSIEVQGLAVTLITHLNPQNREAYFQTVVSGYLAKVSGKVISELREALIKRVDLIKEEKEVRARADGWIISPTLSAVKATSCLQPALKTAEKKLPYLPEASQSSLDQPLQELELLLQQLH